MKGSGHGYTEGVPDVDIDRHQDGNSEKYCGSPREITPVIRKGRHPLDRGVSLEEVDFERELERVYSADIILKNIVNKICENEQTYRDETVDETANEIVANESVTANGTLGEGDTEGGPWKVLERTRDRKREMGEIQDELETMILIANNVTSELNPPEEIVDWINLLLTGGLLEVLALLTKLKNW